MEHNDTSALSGITYELIKSLLSGYGCRMNIVVHTADCYYLEFPLAAAGVSPFFAAVQRKDKSTVLKLNRLLGYMDGNIPLSDSLRQLWDGNFSFVFDKPPNDILPELQMLLERTLLQGYQSLV